MKGSFAALVAFAFIASTSRTQACAGCRNPTMPLVRSGEGPLGERTLRLGAALTGTYARVRHEAGCPDLERCAEVPVQPLYVHDQRLYPIELRLTAEYGFTRHFGVELQAPFRLIRTSIEYTTPAGAPYEPLDPGVHHRNETVAGPSDFWLLYRAGTTLGGVWFALRSGFSLPLGRTEEDPFALGDRGISHQHIQLGSGTFDPVGILEASRVFGALSVQAFAQAQASLYENGHGYRAPVRLYGGASVGHALFGDFRGMLGLEALHESAERWSGVVRQDGSLGRSELLAALTLVWSREETELRASARPTLARHIVRGSEDPGELESPLVMTLSVSHELH